MKLIKAVELSNLVIVIIVFIYVAYKIIVSCPNIKYWGDLEMVCVPLMINAILLNRTDLCVRLGTWIKPIALFFALTPFLLNLWKLGSYHKVEYFLYSFAFMIELISYFVIFYNKSIVDEKNNKHLRKELIIPIFSVISIFGTGLICFYFLINGQYKMCLYVFPAIIILFIDNIHSIRCLLGKNRLKVLILPIICLITYIPPLTILSVPILFLEDNIFEFSFIAINSIFVIVCVIITSIIGQPETKNII